MRLRFRYNNHIEHYPLPLCPKLTPIDSYQIYLPSVHWSILLTTYSEGQHPKYWGEKLRFTQREK